MKAVTKGTVSLIAGIALLFGFVALVIDDPGAHYDAVHVQQGGNSYYAIRHVHFILPNYVSTIEYNDSPQGLKDVKTVVDHLNLGELPRKVTAVQ